MADKKIKIHIQSTADLAAMREVSSAAAHMAEGVSKANERIRQSILKAAAQYNSIAAQADKAARGMGTGYKTLADFLRDIQKESREADRALAKVRAQIVAANKEFKAQEAARHVKNIGKAAKESSQGVGSLNSAASALTRSLGDLGIMMKGIFTGGIFLAGAGAIRGIFSKMTDDIDKQREKIENLKKTVVDNLGTMTDRWREYKSAVADVADAERSAIDTQLNNRREELDLTERLTKATTELARQKRIANGEDAAKVNEEADAELAAADAKKARAESDAKLAAYRDRLEIAKEEKENAWAEVERLRDAKQNLTPVWDAETDEEGKALRKLHLAMDDKIADAKAAAFATDKKIAAEESRLANAQKQRDALEMEIEAKTLKMSNAAAEREKTAREAEAKERERLEKAAAAERARLDRELHQKRMADLREEIATQKAAAAPFRAISAAAQTEFDRAFAMYRDPTRAAAEIAEERDYSADVERLHRDASRYGGKWRIDELSALMSAGDTQGVSDTLGRWRKSSAFTPEVEALVRASAAERTKTTAEDELRKIEANTADLAKKLDELLAIK